MLALYGLADTPDPCIQCVGECSPPPDGRGPDPTRMSSDDYNTAYVACVNLCSLGPCSNQRYGQTEATTSLPPGTTPDTGTNVPGSLLPGPGYHPTPATNWWRVGGALILGLGVGIFLYRRGIHHAA